mgnify:CR=1 FL=1
MIVCSTCKYFDRYTVLPDGRYTCKLSDGIYPKIHDVCLVNRENMGVYGAMKVLHDMQKWRRGCKMPMVSPILFSAAIDVAISVLRSDLRTTQKLKEDGQERSDQEPTGGSGQV